MATSAELAGQIAEYDRNKVTSTDALNEALGQFGVPEIRKTVGGLRTTISNTTNALKNVDPSVTGRTQGSLVTEAQRQKQVSNERAPIAGQLGEQTSALTDQDRSLQEALGQATTQSTNKVNDYVRGRQNLQSQYDTTYQREQAEAEAQRQREAEAQRRAEADREYNYRAQQDAISNRLASSKGSSSAAAPQQSLQSVISGGLAGATGSDGKVSPKTWNQAYQKWVGEGRNGMEFINSFGNFVNKSHIKDYLGPWKG